MKKAVLVLGCILLGVCCGCTVRSQTSPEEVPQAGEILSETIIWEESREETGTETTADQAEAEIPQEPEAETGTEAEAAAGAAASVAAGAASEELNMETVMRLFAEQTLGSTDFSVYENGLCEEGDWYDSLDFTFPYEDEQYRVSVSRQHEDGIVSDVWLTRLSDYETCLLYSEDPRYQTVERIETFLENKPQISDWLTLTLPEAYTLLAYDARVGNAGGALIEPVVYEVLGENGPDGLVKDWTMAGSVGKIPDAQELFRFENGQLLEVGASLWNHTSMEKVETLEGLDCPAVLYQVNHDLYTAADLGELEEQGTDVPQEAQTSDYWYFFFGRPGEDTGYYLALAQKEFTREQALEIAKTVKLA